MSALLIRDATPADCELIVDFIRRLARYEKLEHEVEATPADIQQHLFSGQPAAAVRIAEWHGQPVGFTLFFSIFSTFQGRPGIHLEDLFVDEPARGKGIGKALLADLAQLTVARGGGRLEWVVLDWNTPAIDFYRSLNAKHLDDWQYFRLHGQPLGALARMAENA